ncbi:MAG: ABC transporter permease subunit [Butyrivibrio sp.]|nr:ABC transporter permease subunit [Butyrivibrio sp.]
MQLLNGKKVKDEKFYMESKYKLFLMFLPFILLTFVFCYLPLWGWRYAFFDYKAGDILSARNFVGFKWFEELVRNKTTMDDMVRVMENTLAMSGLGIATSWCPMAFAIFLSEIKHTRFRRFVQTFTTIPNFISWVLVFAIAFCIFSTDGFLSSIMVNLGIWSQGQNLLMSGSHVWLKMLLWGMWKGLGWSAIIYIAGISGIDQQLYEAATVDGAGRFQRMWHVTVPGLMPTFYVLLLMSVAGILTNGMDQYLVFKNSSNTAQIMVLDLYVYNMGIVKGAIPLSTVVGMLKSVISVILLFGANGISKLLRGETIV